jgi:hypothetical protein
VSIDQTLVELRADKLFAQAIGISQEKLTVKIDQGELDLVAIAGILGVTPTAGTVKPVVETATITTPLTYAVTNGVTATKDLGVKDANGVPLQCVTGTVAAGQYSVALVAGVSLTYTFFAAGTYTVSYEARVSASGFTAAVANAVAAAAPTFEVRSYGSFKTAGLNVRIYAVAFDKLDWTLSNGKFLVQKLSGQAVDPGTGSVYDISWNN